MRNFPAWEERAAGARWPGPAGLPLPPGSAASSRTGRIGASREGRGREDTGRGSQDTGRGRERGAVPAAGQPAGLRPAPGTRWAGVAGQSQRTARPKDPRFRRSGEGIGAGGRFPKWPGRREKGEEAANCLIYFVCWWQPNPKSFSQRKGCWISVLLPRLGFGLRLRDRLQALPVAAGNKCSFLLCEEYLLTIKMQALLLALTISLGHASCFTKSWSHNLPGCVFAGCQFYLAAEGVTLWHDSSFLLSPCQCSIALQVCSPVSVQ